MENTKRWYDEYGVGEYFDKLEKVAKDDRDMLLVAIKNLIMQGNQDLIHDNILDFPIRDRKRWYDADPLSWVVINALKFVEKDILDKVIELMKDKLI